MGKRTKIICTMGPSTENDDVLRKMIAAGMDVARFNFSHGSHEYHRKHIERVRRIAAELNKNVAIMMDTKGPEIRTRSNEGGALIRLETGEEVFVTSRDVPSTKQCIALDYESLPREVGAGDVIFLDDGLVGLKVTDVTGSEIRCRVTNGGLVGEHKGVNVPNVAVGLPSITEQDRKDIRFSCEMRVDAIAASFVRNAQAVNEIRELCSECGWPEVLVVSKIESAESLQSFDEILAASDGIMVARGDLGVEIPPARVPGVQKQIIRKCNEEYKPVITATQMLESMTQNPRPTRAEVTDVANAIDDGTDCVMLSGETAAGKYPVEAVRTMVEVCLETEANLPERVEYHDRGGLVQNVSGATGFSAVQAARLVGAKALLCPTLSGRTARIMSAFRPRLPIIATAPIDLVLRRSCFYWGVECIMVEEKESLTRICYDTIKQARIQGYLEVDDVVVITAGDPVTSPMAEVGMPTAETATNAFVIAQAF